MLRSRLHGRMPRRMLQSSSRLERTSVDSSTRPMANLRISGCSTSKAHHQNCVGVNKVFIIPFSFLLCWATVTDKHVWDDNSGPFRSSSQIQPSVEPSTFHYAVLVLWITLLYAACILLPFIQQTIRGPTFTAHR